MVQVTNGLAPLSLDHLTLYHTTDPMFHNSPVLIFHGPSTTANNTLNSSRIQIHIFTAAGFQSYPRITISPNSALYQVVNYLPRDRQGDEVCRGLACGLYKYYKEVPEVVKGSLIVTTIHSRPSSRRPGSAPPDLFGEQHVADLVCNMVKVENIHDVVRDLGGALMEQHISNVDIDLVLPPKSISTIAEMEDIQEDDMDDDDFLDPALRRYGKYAPLIKLFGQPTFLPTSRLRRAPSRPHSLVRSKSFRKDQKAAVRREMGEFVDTEERYVAKMHELVNHMVDDFRASVRQRSAASFSPSEEELQRLFPPSLDRILQANSAFMVVIKNIMDETEQEAMNDIEADLVGSTAPRGAGRPKDPIGAVAFAKALLEWFPQFSDCYQDYIRASQEFPQLITSFLVTPSSLSQRIKQTGEQRLRSAVIEPVQRLPRYSLFIDNILKYLPNTHPATASMLKARDIITEICSLDSPTADKSEAVKRIKPLVESWPANLKPRGRMISAVDVEEYPIPFHVDDPNSNPKSGILVLFADTVILLEKVGERRVTARALVAEIDRPTAANMMASATAAAGGKKHVYELAFGSSYKLGDTSYTHSLDGRILLMTSLNPPQEYSSFGTHKRRPMYTFRALLPQGPYESKAPKWTEEVAKARIEGRFSEEERETEKWAVRNTNLREGGINMFAAVFEEGLDYLIQGRREPASIRVVVDHEKGTKSAPVGHYGVDIVVNVTMPPQAGSKYGKYYLEVNGLKGSTCKDMVDNATFMPTFVKRIGDLVSEQHSGANPEHTPAFVSFNGQVLKKMRFQLEIDESKFRPSSPLKSMAKFLGGGGGGSFREHSSKRTPVLGQAPNLGPPATMTPAMRGKSATPEAELATVIERPTNPLVRLEETFTGYIAALQSRKGDIIGKALLSHRQAAELTVNDLYNKFIEHPFDPRIHAESSSDIIFAAFQKYLRLVWSEQMGPVMTVPALEALQEKSAKLFPGDFADYVKSVFGEMAPQNRRAFIAIIKLLADLLDGCGNDGDRGAITLAFAELLVTDDQAHHYINLLDKMVEDAERLFDDLGPGTPGTTSGNTPNGSTSSRHRSTRSRTIGPSDNPNSGSFNSNTSIRRRFGLDNLLRNNSKNDSERPSVWRTLSKQTRSIATGEPVEITGKAKGLNRSRSIDTGTHLLHPKKTSSPERPGTAGSYEATQEPPHEPPHNSNNPRLSTIGASPPPPPPPGPETPARTRSAKNKRRSSLSDLRALMNETTLNSPEPLVSKQLNISPTLKTNNSPRTPGPTRIPGVNRALDYKDNASTITSPTQKENTRPTGNLTERPANIMAPGTLSSDVTSPTGVPLPPTPLPKTPGGRPPNKKVQSNSAIPTLRNRSPPASANSAIPTLRHRSPPASANTAAPSTVARPSTSYGTKSATLSPQKNRLQSAQKLRERIEKEAKTITAASATLQAELAKITEELDALPQQSARRKASLRLRAPAEIRDTHGHPNQSSLPGVKIPARGSSREKKEEMGPESEVLKALREQLKNLQTKIPVMLAEVTNANEQTKTDMEKSLVAAESKLRALDQLYREATAENELLYEKMNGELGKIVKALKQSRTTLTKAASGSGGDDVQERMREKEEWVAKILAASEEKMRVSAENARLKREVVGLKAMVRGLMSGKENETVDKGAVDLTK